jgi:molybdenum cofactor sulfurtransferase
MVLSLLFLLSATAFASDRLSSFLSRHSPSYLYSNQQNPLAAEARFKGVHYLDWTGSALYTAEQLERSRAVLLTEVYGNPHSPNPSSHRSSLAIDALRARILAFLGVPGGDEARHGYRVVLTRSATEALKIVAQTFPWKSGAKFAYLSRNHNSVIGMREEAKSGGAQWVSMTPDEVARRLKGETVKEDGDQENDDDEEEEEEEDGGDDGQLHHLFAYPAESNFAGELYPLDWIDKIHRGRRPVPGAGRWHVLLDASAFVPTRRLNLTEHDADFVCLSLYKLFGHPTGLGALVVKRSAVHLLHKRYFGGGSIMAVSADHDAHTDLADYHRLEDGTPNFLGAVEALVGFDTIEAVGMERIERHVDALTSFTFEELSGLRHPGSGARMVVIYGHHGERKNGAIITFNVVHANGAFLSKSQVVTEASRRGIHLRAGCACNPGGCAEELGLTWEELAPLFQKRTGGCAMAQTDGVGSEHKVLGAVRASFGYLSTFDDAQALIDLVRDLATDGVPVFLKKEL